jgi:MFS-type transporter involved in bile tolerance (Atg22 family)
MLTYNSLGRPTPISTTGIDQGSLDIEGITYGGLKWLFVIGAIIIFIMAFPYIFHKEVENPQNISFKENWNVSRKVFRSTGREIVRDKNSLLFFLAWFFITDAANTAILFMSPIITDAVYSGAENATNVRDMILFIAIGGSLIFGILTGVFLKRIGPRKTFIINAICWALGIVFTIFAGWQMTNISTNLPNLPPWLMFIGATFIGVGFGGIWIIGRQFITVLAPPDKLAQYGGFQKIAGRVSAIVSPIVFSVLFFVSARYIGTHNAYRVSLGYLFLSFNIGLTILLFIRDPYKRYDAGERAPYKDLYVKVPK